MKTTQIVGVIHKSPTVFPTLLVLLSMAERYRFIKSIGDRLGMHNHVIVFVSNIMLVLCIVYAHNPFHFLYVYSFDRLFVYLPLSPTAAKAVAVGMILG
jgi:hypothetical protein